MNFIQKILYTMVIMLFFACLVVAIGIAFAEEPICIVYNGNITSDAVPEPLDGVYAFRGYDNKAYYRTYYKGREILLTSEEDYKIIMGEQ